jgi:hypothetical protein
MITVASGEVMKKMRSVLAPGKGKQNNLFSESFSKSLPGIGPCLDYRSNAMADAIGDIVFVREAISAAERLRPH